MENIKNLKQFLLLQYVHILHFFAVMTALLSNTNSDAVMNVYFPLNTCLG